MDALFASLIHPSRMTSYQPTDFTFASAVDGAAEITFTPLEREDLDVHLPARCLIFFLPAGQTSAIPGGPTVTPALDSIAIQILSISDIATAETHRAASPSTRPIAMRVTGTIKTSITPAASSHFFFVRSEGKARRSQK